MLRVARARARAAAPRPREPSSIVLLGSAVLVSFLVCLLVFLSGSRAPFSSAAAVLPIVSASSPDRLLPEVAALGLAPAAPTGFVSAQPAAPPTTTAPVTAAAPVADDTARSVGPQPNFLSIQPAATPTPASALAVGDGESGRGLPYRACLEAVYDKGSGGCVPEDWRAWNDKPETKALIEEVGGLTPAMRAFMNVYEAGAWGNDASGCGSGRGSHPHFAARTICNLAALIPTLLQVDLLIDFPCGDQQWSPMLRALLPQMKYVGVDAMPGLVQRNRVVHGKPGRVEFLLGELDTPRVFDTLRARAPHMWAPGDVVAVLSRHVLEHNTQATTQAYFASLFASNATFFIGTQIAVQSNDGSQILGGAAGYNFHLPPFSFNRGLVEWMETPALAGADEGGTMIEVWEIARMRQS
jgi:hypothetical protein